MNCHPRPYYCARNRAIIEQSKTHSVHELAKRYPLSIPTIRAIIRYTNPNREPSGYLRYRDEQDEPVKPKYVYFETLAMLKKKPALLFEHANPDICDCWNWRYGKNSSGYGYVRIGRIRLLAHRVAAYIVGMIANPRKPKKADDPHFILHTCDNPGCINPFHLRPGTIKENNLDRAAKGRNRNRATGKLPKKEAPKLLQ